MSIEDNALELELRFQAIGHMARYLNFLSARGALTERSVADICVSFLNQLEEAMAKKPVNSKVVKGIKGTTAKKPTKPRKKNSEC